MWFLACCLPALLSATGSLRADTLTVAVAANFAETLEAVVELFEQASGHEVTVSRGSSGRHFAQILNGAPYDLFFSADAGRPEALIDARRLSESRVQVYALGQLVVWGPAMPQSEIRNRLVAGEFTRLAIANPRLAPYGQAALEVLDALGLPVGQLDAEGRLLRGENVAQAAQFVASGNAELGLVALSQMQNLPAAQYWQVPVALHQPIVQKLAILNESPAALALVGFLATAAARDVLTRHGYLLPDNN